MKNSDFMLLRRVQSEQSLLTWPLVWATSALAVKIFIGLGTWQLPMSFRPRMVATSTQANSTNICVLLIESTIAMLVSVPSLCTR